MNGPLAPIQIPNSFFLQSEVLGAFGIDDAKQFRSVARIKPADYKALIENSGVKIRTRALGTVAGDTNFAWFTPEQAFVDTAWIAKLVNENVVTKAFAAAAADADLRDADSLRGARKAAAVRAGVIHRDRGRSAPGRIDARRDRRHRAAAPPAGSVAAQFRDTLKAPDPVEVVRDRVKAYKERIAGLLGDASPAAARTAEQQRLYSLLLDRRRAFASHPLFGNLVESGALLPLP